MKLETMRRILRARCIVHYVLGSRVYAEDLYTIEGKPYTEIVDVTAFARRELYEWLGY